MSREKAKGSAWERAIVEFLRPFAPHVERRAAGATKDRGDIAGIPGVVIEAKNCRTIDLAGWLDEANLEATNDRADLGVVWIHRRGKASPGAGYVLLDGATFVDLLAAAGYIKPLERL